MIQLMMESARDAAVYDVALADSIISWISLCPENRVIQLMMESSGSAAVYDAPLPDSIISRTESAFAMSNRVIKLIMASARGAAVYDAPLADSIISWISLRPEQFSWWWNLRELGCIWRASPRRFHHQLNQPLPWAIGGDTSDDGICEKRGCIWRASRLFHHQPNWISLCPKQQGDQCPSSSLWLYSAWFFTLYTFLIPRLIVKQLFSYKKLIW